ncbi:hypothetical protein KQQSB11_260484 [Klebsiella quasipneumoniae subsp. quasipneumoniae]|nr:hypothetical protein KQQSB11_260484 [Klebsiella quasipneumoniae subsp. quasipneumoniae]
MPCPCNQNYNKVAYVSYAYHRDSYVYYINLVSSEKHLPSQYFIYTSAYRSRISVWLRF